MIIRWGVDREALHLDIRWDRPEPLLLLARALQGIDRPREALDVLTRALPLLEGDARQRLEAFIQSQR